jgi:DNA-binding XRE family transcriptional regulator
MLDKTPERIKEGRRKVGLSQSELGKIVHVTKQSVSKWEKGENIPEAQTMNKLADLFGYTIDYLYGRCDKQNDDIKKVSRTLLHKQYPCHTANVIKLTPNTKKGALRLPFQGSCRRSRLRISSRVDE